jgi:hypothetical protein
MANHKRDSIKYPAPDFSAANRSIDSTPSGLPGETGCTLELSHKLQSGTSIAELMQTYSNTVQRLAPHDCLRFEHKALNIDVRIGHGGLHECTYNLFFSHYSLGRVTLSRDRKFSDEELASLENTLCVLFYPLDEMIHNGC